MPRKSRGRGFCHTKRGRGKTDSGGHGRGFVGRRKLDVDCSITSESGDERSVSLSPSPDLLLDNSCDTMHFTTALASPASSESLGMQLSGDESGLGSGSIASETQPFSEETPDLNAETTPTFVNPSVAVLNETLNILRAVLPSDWIPVVDQKGFNILLMSRGEDKSVQRNVFFPFNGSLRLTVHRRAVCDSFLKEAIKVCGQLLPLSALSIKAFVDKVMAVVNYIRSFEVCAGACDIEYKHFWKDDEKGFVDKNPYGESRYQITYRSVECDMLVAVRKWKCKQCNKTADRLRHRVVGDNITDYDRNTPNVFLSDEQMKCKLQAQHKELRAARRKIERLQNRIAETLKTHGVHVESSVSESLEDALKSSNLPPDKQQLRDLFIQQQHKAASVKSSQGMRWHPVLIRFALLIKAHSSAALNAIRESGLISLPGDRTLFDYSHTLPQMEGINTGKIERLSQKVRNYSKGHQSYHNLLMDEIHISEKLVYQKSTGEMLGYVKLTEAEKELENLMHVIQDKDPLKEEPPAAKRMLAYMVKGLTNDVKEVVAAFPTSSPTKEFLYDRTWDVITHLEVAGIKTLSVVCDGSSVNRGFIQMHVPSGPETTLQSGVIFATTNMCAPERILYFISDPPHLLKTLRNCFAKSGVHPKATRRLTKGGQMILWKTIERLFLENHEDTIRSSYKLTAQNVYLNSYSCMNVLSASQVMSNTVSVDLETRKWPGTSETCKFIKNVNNFFDNLNGAHSAMGRRKANPRLDPYTSSGDKRFDELDGFVDYLRDWRNQVLLPKNIPIKTKKMMFIPDQTYEGIEMTVNAFKGAVKFMLDVAKADFINARIFCQDPLEQYFGKQRASIGGGSAPTTQQFYESDLKISIHRDFNVQKRSGNVEAVNTCMDMSGEPLPKRPRRPK